MSRLPPFGAPRAPETMADWADGVGLQVAKARQAGKTSSTVLQVLYTLADKLVLSGVCEKLGGRGPPRVTESDQERPIRLGRSGPASLVTFRNRVHCRGEMIPVELA